MAVSDETSNDRGWMYSGWKRGKPTDEWYETTKEFLDFAFSAQANVVHNGKIKCPCADCRNYITKDRDDVELDLCGFGFKRNYSVWTEHGEERIHRTDHVVVDDKRSNVKPSNSMSCQALLRRNQYLEKRNKRNGSYFKVLFANAGLDVPEDLEDDFMEDTDHLHLSCRSTENGGTPLTPSSHAEDQIGTPPSGQHDVDHRAREDSPIIDG